MRVVMLGLGYGFLALGVVGLFLPILQGILFILVGLLILARHAGWAERALGRFKRAHPRAASLIAQAEAIADRWVHRTGDRLEGLWRRLVGGRQ
jgi:uncharacterized membrane protein YbaN (DUF454 family)